MEFPSWLQSALKRRLDTITARIERHLDTQEEQNAFDALLLGMEEQQKANFLDWEDKQNFVLAVKQEALYLQGVKDGAQLAYALLECRCLFDEDSSKGN